MCVITSSEASEVTDVITIDLILMIFVIAVIFQYIVFITASRGGCHRANQSYAEYSVVLLRLLRAGCDIRIHLFRRRNYCENVVTSKF